MSSLELFAGPTAMRTLQADGLHADQVRMIVGASGGPKWFVLYGLDRYLFGEFFAGRRQPLATLGSSAGAWRLSCLGQRDPLAAIDRLATGYARQRYSERPGMQEISHEAGLLVDILLGSSGAVDIAENPVVQVHIVVDRARGLLASDRKALLMCGLALCAGSNAVSRRALRFWFERLLFHAGAPLTSLAELHDMPTRCVPLQPDNVRAALLASGSIPLVMEGVRELPGAAPGVYRDGGITDYHFDLPFLDGEGLVLYPHFYPWVIPGWFDKMLPWRRARAANYHNVLMVVPSREFVASLPYGKIPDRKDFKVMDDDTRLRYWQRVLSASARLGDEFAAMVAVGKGLDSVRPLGDLLKK